MLALAGCSGSGAGFDFSKVGLGESGPKVGSVGHVQGFLGGVAADEPRAALVGRDILSAGGTAQDAAVATYFALAVTLPSAAGLGGGGVCVSHNYATKTTEALEFLARPPASVPSSATRPSAVPGNPRGFFALHSKNGRMRWGELVAPAEKLARFGFQVSRAFPQGAERVEQALMADPDIRRVFSRPTGEGSGSKLVGEGDFLTQLDLATTLGRLRSKGPGDFYTGPWAKELVAATQAAGGSLDVEDLRAYSPQWRETIRSRLGNLTVHFAPPPAAAGGVAAQMWAMLTKGDRFEDAPLNERSHLLAEVALRAYGDRSRWMREDGSVDGPAVDLVNDALIVKLMNSYRPEGRTPATALTPPPADRPETPSATSFVAVDREGSAVACTVTLNNVFGTGRMARGTGIVLAAMPGQGGRGAISLGPMMVINHHVNEFYYAAAASGGEAAPTALVGVAVRAMILGQPLGEALSAARVHHGGMPDQVFHEPSLGQSDVEGLTQRGYAVAATPSLGRVNAALCRNGIPPKPESCSIMADPRGSGLAAGAD